jgi:hypothetical protein
MLHSALSCELSDSYRFVHITLGFALELNVVPDLFFESVVDSRNGQKKQFIEEHLLP